MIQDILISSLFFSVIVLLLVALVLGARYWLSPQGAATLTVNGQTLLAERGRNLLTILSENDIYLPSPCGGRAMCGQCKVVFADGARQLLPTEMGHLTRREARNGTRLACVTRIRDDLRVQVPEQYMSAQQRRCQVTSTRYLSTYMKEITLALPDHEPLVFEAGQYILLHAPAYDVRFGDFIIDSQYRDTWERTGLLALESRVRGSVTRAYSLANSPQQNQMITLVVRIALPPPDAKPGIPPGQVSSYLFSLKPGDEVRVTGPFGDFRAQDSNREMVLVAGGAGIAPMRSIVLDQLEAHPTKRKISLWYGVRSLQDLCYVKEFSALATRHNNFSWHAALSEPRAATQWSGYTGFIHAVVHDDYLETHPAPEELEYYLCGPPVMSLAVTNMLEDLGVDKSSILFDDFGSAP
jgi:Na+-transporting NADH:ubiquinone oxidoreductase subunit F